MKIAAIDFYHFCIPFVVPVKVGDAVLEDREGLIIALTDESGWTGCGEIAPLPGLDEATLDLCRGELLSLQGSLLNAPLRFDRFQPTEPLLEIISIPAPWTSHTLFGLESALLGLYLQQIRDNDILHPPSIPVNGLFVPQFSPEYFGQQVLKMRNAGFQTVKIKIGRLDAAEEIRQILRLSEQMGTDTVLRLDGNRNLAQETYERYYAALNHLRVEYVEEPLANPAAGEVPWPLALDESLSSRLDTNDPHPSSLSKTIRAIILKPGLLRGLHGMARCAADAAGTGMKTVFSSAFNTGITLATMGLFSGIIHLPLETAHGLDTLQYLAADVLVEPPVIHEGSLIIPAGILSGNARLNSAVMEKIAP
ncbi:MAG: enolase C-terminal domain-like protein [Syntrophales bacterium]|nr:enolase C-terminal domain-like protein [Syntrophales bacterium]